MYMASGPVSYTYGNVMRYTDTMDSYGGQSGSGVWWTVNGEPVLVGVHTLGGTFSNG